MRLRAPPHPASHEACGSADESSHTLPAAQAKARSAATAARARVQAAEAEASVGATVNGQPLPAADGCSRAQGSNASRACTKWQPVADRLRNALRGTQVWTRKAWTTLNLQKYICHGVYRAHCVQAVHDAPSSCVQERGEVQNVRRPNGMRLAQPRTDWVPSDGIC